MDDADFADLVSRARDGDEAALERLLQTFEEDVRMMVRVRLPRALRSQFDSMDFVQSIWKSIFATPEGTEGLPLDNPRQFQGYLAGVARNKVLEEYRRRTRTRKYDISREESLYVRRGDREQPRAVVANDPTPSEEATVADQLDRLLAGRDPVEARVVELRRQGLTFDEIAERTGMNERSVRRVIGAIRERLEREAQRWQ